jgi:hypothetical protein
MHAPIFQIMTCSCQYHITCSGQLQCSFPKARPTSSLKYTAYESYLSNAYTSFTPNMHRLEDYFRTRSMQLHVSHPQPWPRSSLSDHDVTCSYQCHIGWSGKLPCTFPTANPTSCLRNIAYESNHSAAEKLFTPDKHRLEDYFCTRQRRNLWC